MQGRHGIDSPSPLLTTGLTTSSMFRGSFQRSIFSVCVCVCVCVCVLCVVCVCLLCVCVFVVCVCVCVCCVCVFVVCLCVLCVCCVCVCVCVCVHFSCFRLNDLEVGEVIGQGFFGSVTKVQDSRGCYYVPILFLILSPSPPPSPPPSQSPFLWLMCR